MEEKELLFELSNTPGVSGYEEKIFSKLKEHFSKYTDEFIYGKLGDIAAVKRGEGENRLKIMLADMQMKSGLLLRIYTKEGLSISQA
jgi:endoglucanase